MLVLQREIIPVWLLLRHFCILVKVEFRTCISTLLYCNSYWSKRVHPVWILSQVKARDGQQIQSRVRALDTLVQISGVPQQQQVSFCFYWLIIYWITDINISLFYTFLMLISLSSFFICQEETVGGSVSVVWVLLWLWGVGGLAVWALVEAADGCTRTRP